MKSSKSVHSHPLLREPQDFSLVLGGPLFQLLRRTHLADDHLLLLRQRIVVISLFCRFLVALPLLISAELLVHQRMRSVVKVFLERHLIPESAMARFDAALASAMRLRNSVTAELLLIGFVYGVGVLIIWRHYTALDAATWYATPSAEGSKLSLTGIWYSYVSLPFFQFILLRWYFRIFVWARFL